MTVSIVVAMDRNRVIGVDNKLPWHLPADLKRFKELTMGHHIIMGRKTFESIGLPLPGRTTVVITRQQNFRAEGCKVVHSLEDALNAAQDDTEAFVIGGAEIFAHALDCANRLYVTQIDTQVKKGDAYFPEISQTDWKIISEKTCEPDERNPFRYTYVDLLKRNH